MGLRLTLESQALAIAYSSKNSRTWTRGHYSPASVHLSLFLCVPCCDCYIIHRDKKFYSSTFFAPVFLCFALRMSLCSGVLAQVF